MVDAHVFNPWIMKSLLSLPIFLGIFALVSSCTNNKDAGKKQAPNSFESLEVNWPAEFNLVNIRSSYDGEMQCAYFIESSNPNQAPLIVSLHSWGGDYTQKDELAHLSAISNLNYIHPNFRGPNNTKEACCSAQAITDIDDAISFAIENGNVDSSRIYIIGASGGGYAALCSFMRSKHNVRVFSAWVPISDLVAWYHQSKIRGTGYDKDILRCTNSYKSLNETLARQRSPINWPTPVDRLNHSKLLLYAGVNDGIQGSVPITQSINFYNKVLTDLGIDDSVQFVTVSEKLRLLKFRKPIDNYGTIDGRKICLRKASRNIRLTIFDGNHEMLTNFAFNELVNESN